MLITADWALPVCSPPIRGAGVLVDGDQIVAVGRAVDLASHPLAAECHHFPGHMMAPGLVNAHTHLTLTALAGVVPSMPFAEWLPRLVAALKPWEIGDHEASGVVGAQECLLAGVTAVGDIAYGAAEVARASGAGLGGVYYWELLGLNADEVDSTLADLRYPQSPDAYGRRVTCGLSPHSPYTSGPALLRAVHEHAERLGVPSAIHVAESAAEVELLCTGEGPLATTAARTAFGFRPPGTSTVRYLEALGVLEAVTAVHLCHLEAEDIARLASAARGAATCPRSNDYLHNPRPNVAAMLTAGIPVGVGTDSSASNVDLDLMEEVRAIAAVETHLSADALLRLATVDGARALGIEDRFGALAPGLCADLGLYAIETEKDPLGAFVSRGGRETLISLLAGGVWRVWNGTLTSRDRTAEARARDAAARSRVALKALTSS